MQRGEKGTGGDPVRRMSSLRVLRVSSVINYSAAYTRIQRGRAVNGHLKFVTISPL
jgi:hypothetical protein